MENHKACTIPLCKCIDTHPFLTLRLDNVEGQCCMIQRIKPSFHDRNFLAKAKYFIWHIPQIQNFDCHFVLIKLLEEEIESYAVPIQSLHDQVDETLGDEDKTSPEIVDRCRT